MSVDLCQPQSIVVNGAIIEDKGPGIDSR